MCHSPGCLVGSSVNLVIHVFKRNRFVMELKIVLMDLMSLFLHVAVRLSVCLPACLPACTTADSLLSKTLVGDLEN